MSAITDNLADIGWGLLVTLVISALSYLGGLLLGSLMAVFRVGPIPPLRALGAAWVTVACNIPNLCLMVLVGLALPHAGITIPLFWSVIVALIFSSSGFVCETVRSGINSVSKGQIEAARALGMPFGLIIRGIVLPQALARTIQPLVNIFIACLIGSSLAAAIGVVELTAVTQKINQDRAAGVITFLTSGLTYLAIAFAATKFGGLLERRLEFMGKERA